LPFVARSQVYFFLNSADQESVHTSGQEGALPTDESASSGGAKITGSTSELLFFFHFHPNHHFQIAFYLVLTTDP